MSKKDSPIVIPPGRISLKEKRRVFVREKHLPRNWKARRLLYIFFLLLLSIPNIELATNLGSFCRLSFFLGYIYIPSLSFPKQLARN